MVKLVYIIACIAIAMIGWFVFGDPGKYIGMTTALLRGVPYVPDAKKAGTDVAAAPIAASTMACRYIKLFRDDGIKIRTVSIGIDAFDKDGVLIAADKPEVDPDVYTRLDLGRDIGVSRIVIRNRSDNNGLFLERINGCRLLVTNAAGVATLYTDLLSGSNAIYTFTPPTHPPVLTVCGYSGC